MKNTRRLPLLPVLALGLILETLQPKPLHAIPDPDAENGQWTLPAPVPPGPGTPSGGTSEGDYGAPDRRRMDEERRKNVLDQLCRKLKLNKNFDFGGGDRPTLTAGVSRRMEADIDGRLALIDEETLGITGSKSVARAVGAEGMSGSLWVGGGLTGKSMVIRRLGSFSTCGEIKRLIDVTDVKVLVPVNAKRIQEMGAGELWRLPLTVHIGYGASFSEVLSDGQLTISIGASKGKGGTASMTLWRLSEKEARFRFRIDFVQVHSRNLNVSKTFTPLEFATAGEGFLMKFVKSQTNRQLREYVSASLSWGRAKSDGKRVILEYTIDPTDPAQAEAMAEAVKGNLKVLFKLARRLSTSKTSGEETRAAYDDFQKDNTLKLGEPQYAALSEYGARSESFGLNVPLLFRYYSSDAFGRDRVTRYTGDKGEYFFFNASRSPNAEYFNAPFLGPLVKDLESRNVDAIAYRPDGGPAEGPIAVYVNNRGMLRLPQSEVERAVEDANSILRLAGAARAEGPKPGMEIPLRDFLPEAEVPQPAGRAGAPEAEPADRKGWLSFTLVMNRKAVEAALSASSAEVLKAFARATSPGDRGLARWLVENARLERGELVYDESRAKEDLGLHDGESRWMRKMSLEAAGLARDVAEAAAETDPIARAEKFAKAFSHESHSGLSHRDVMRVLVQFADPMDLTGDFVSAIEGMGKAPDAKAHYVLKKMRPEVPVLKEAGQARSRFVDGSILTD